MDLLLPDFVKLRQEAERLRTFYKWPASAKADPETLARAGYFYTGIEDRVQCAFCRGFVRNWLSTDVPVDEHKRHFPECPFVRGMEVGNVPKLVPNSVAADWRTGNESDTQMQPGASSQTLVREATATWEPGQIQHLAISSLTEPPKYHNYVAVENRIHSFRAGKVSRGQTAEGLAEAGWFYIGPGDKVLCFQCGGNLRDWEPNDDPWEEHKKWYPNCAYIKTQNQLTPQTNVESRQRHPLLLPSSSPGAYHVDHKEIEALMNTPTVRVMQLHFGYSRDMVRTAIEHRLSTTGDYFPNAESFLNALIEMDNAEHASERNRISRPSASSSQQSDSTGKKERKRKKRTKEKKLSASGEDIRSAGTPTAPENDQQHVNLGESPKADSSLSHSDGDISVVSANQASSDEDNDCEVQANRPVKNITFDTSDEHWRCCKICMDMPWDVLLTSCGHALCQICLSTWTEDLYPQEPSCPFCRKTITEAIKPKLANMSEVRPQTPTEVKDDQNEA